MSGMRPYAGTRHLAAARALGQGTYCIVDRKDHTRLVYRLEVPATPGEAQLEFTIGELGSFIFTVKNPVGRGPDDPGLAEKAEYSPEKQTEFQHYSWIPVRDTQLLDYPRCEFLLVGVKEDEPGRLNKVEQQLDEASQQLGVESDEEEMLAAMKEEMQAEKLGINVKPAETGEMA